MQAKGNFINGVWREVSKATGHIISTNPANPAEVIWEQDVSVDAVNDAVAAANAAFKPWRKLSLDERAAVLMKLKKEIDQNAAQIAELIAREAGKARSGESVLAAAG